MLVGRQLRHAATFGSSVAAGRDGVWMRLGGLGVPGVPGPKELLQLAERGYEAIEQAIALVPRMVVLVGEVEAVVAKVNTVMSKVDETQRAADRIG